MATHDAPRAQQCPPLPAPGSDVPLVLFQSPSFPQGLAFGASLGVSFGDYDADGWIDIYVNLTGDLWRNLAGQDFVLAKNLNPGGFVPQYGASFGDYNNDGRPDLATEPRPGSQFRLFRNDGGGNFTDISTNPQLVNVVPRNDSSETICWGDIDFDGYLDLFLPTYPPSVGQVGVQDNYFWKNLGPTGPGGAYRFSEVSRAASLAVPPANNRPEGAQFCDYDHDGDLDLYSNGSIYRNESTPGVPRFVPMTTPGSGIGLNGLLDEGTVFLDYDLDGDFDLLVNYTTQGSVLWENRGDGTFFKAEASIIDCAGLGRDFGVSAEDWDNDGDIDISTQFMFRRNMLVETGQRKFTVASHSMSAVNIERAQPAWGDIDKDGDLDAAIANFSLITPTATGNLFENTLYSGSTPAFARRYVRVRPVRDSASVPGGLDNEFGAVAHICVEGEDDVQRKKFTASGHGYLTQGEYALHFGMPPLGGALLRFDVAVDFPNDPAEGPWRVDKHVNPLLGGIALETLIDREIVVYRSGRVRLEGCDVVPSPMESPVLRTTVGGLSFPGASSPLPPPIQAPPDTWVGLDFTTSGQQRIVEVVLDGVLASGSPFNLALWDVAIPGSPRLVSSFSRTPNVRNRRIFLPVDLVVRAKGHYRLVAKVQSYRSTTVSAPVSAGGMTTRGGLLFVDTSPAGGAAVAAAGIDSTRIEMALRYRTALVGVAQNLGSGLPGALGVPASLTASGSIVGGGVSTLHLGGAAPNALVLMVVGVGVECFSTVPPILVPASPLIVPSPFPTGPTGQLNIPVSIPLGFPPGLPLAFQLWYLDPLAPAGVASSNALMLRLP